MDAGDKRQGSQPRMDDKAKESPEDKADEETRKKRRPLIAIIGIVVVVSLLVGAGSLLLD